MNNPKLNMYSPFSSLGYGVAGTNIFKALSMSGHDIAFFLIGQLEGSETDTALVKEAIEKGDLFEDFSDAPCFKIWHEFSLSERIGSGPCFAMPFFEINELDQRRINHLNSVDGIIVPSNWAKDIVKSHTQTPPLVGVAPLGVDASIFTHGPHKTTDKCVFLNCGKWEKRKGHDLLLEMFRMAFPDETDVELWMMSENPFLAQSNGLIKHAHEWNRYYQSDPRVKLISRVESHSDVASIMASADCGVFPSRAEGWNLELLEMMSMGKHVIATDYSAHTEFCTKDNCDLIDIETLEKARDDLFFDGSTGEWACLTGGPFKQTVDYMRSFYEAWRKEPVQYNTDGVETAKKFSWMNTATRIEEIIYGSQSSATK